MPSPARSPFPLTALDAYLLAQDASVPMNNHFVVDLAVPVSKDRLLETLRTLYRQIPILRSFLVDARTSPRRYVADAPWFDVEEHVRFRDTWDDVAFEEFLAGRFDLESAPPLRVLAIARPRAGQRLVFSVHHSAFDGVAQARLLDLFFTAHAKAPLPGWATSADAVTFRPVLRALGYATTARESVRALDAAFVKPWPRAASIVDHADHPSRQVRADVLCLAPDDHRRLVIRAKALGLSSPTRLLLYAIAKTLDRMARERGQLEEPVVFALASSLRFALRTAKLNRSFQNLVGLVTIRCPRAEIASDAFARTLSADVEATTTTECTARTLLLASVVTRLVPFSRLSAMAAKNDADPTKIRSSALVSGGLIPRAAAVHGLSIEKVFVRSALSKSPGVSFLLAGTRDAPTITMQVLSELVPRDAAASLLAGVVEEMTLDLDVLRARGQA